MSDAAALQHFVMRPGGCLSLSLFFCECVNKGLSVAGLLTVGPVWSVPASPVVEERGWPL